MHAGCVTDPQVKFLVHVRTTCKVPKPQATGSGLHSQQSNVTCGRHGLIFPASLDMLQWLDVFIIIDKCLSFSMTRAQGQLLLLLRTPPMDLPKLLLQPGPVQSCWAHLPPDVHDSLAVTGAAAAAAPGPTAAAAAAAAAESLPDEQQQQQQ